jgi:hypothetical protein
MKEDNDGIEQRTSAHRDRDLSPFFTRQICSREASEKHILAMWLVSKKIRREKLDQFLLFYCSREQIHLVENGLKAFRITRETCSANRLVWQLAQQVSLCADSFWEDLTF